MQKRLIAVATALAVVLIATPAAATASPTPTPSPHPLLANVVDPVPAGFPSWEAVFDRQNLMSEALTAIRAADDNDDYSTAYASPLAEALVVYWRGPVSPHVQAVINEWRQSTPIDVVPAAYSEAELLTELYRLKREEPALGWMSPEHDGSGLRVAWRDETSSALPRALPVSAVHLRNVPDPGPVAFDSRQADGSPYSAGALTNNCTTSFAVNHAGTTKLLYAAHCGTNGTTVKTGAGVTMGAVQNANAARDISLINARGQGWMWDGGPQSTFRKNVIRADASAKGHLTCQSGAASGVRCGLTVTDIDVFDGLGYGPFVAVKSADGTNASGSGDSGGPYFSTSGTSSVIAKGIVSGHDSRYEVPCTGENWPGRKCGSVAYYIDVIKAMTFLSATIVTG